jgi:hypothetical protein
MGDGQTEVGEARLEIVVKAGERARRDHGVVGADAARQVAGDRSLQRLVAGGDARLELRPQIGRDLDGEIAHAMGQAALARRAWKAFLDRSYDPRRAVGRPSLGRRQGQLQYMFNIRRLPLLPVAQLQKEAPKVVGEKRLVTENDALRPVKA